MSVYKPDDSPYWYVAYNDEMGARVRLSTKRTTKRDALVVEAELRNRVERIRLGLEIRTVNPAHRTVGDAVGWWLEHIASRQAQAVKVAYVVARHINGHAIGKLQLEHVASGAVAKWLHEKADEVSPATANKLRAYLMSVFSRMIERGEFLGANPVKATKKLKTTPPRRRALLASYAQALMSNPPTPGWLVAFTAGAYAGMRRGEIERAFGAPGWPDVDLDSRIISLQKTKTGQPRRVAIHSVLLDVLEDAKRRKVALPTRGAYEGSGDRVKEALLRAGIDDKRATFHGLRGMWATQMLTSGASRDATLFMGWGPRTTTTMDLHYIAFPDAELVREIERLTYPLKGDDDGKQE